MAGRVTAGQKQTYEGDRLHEIDGRWAVEQLRGRELDDGDARLRRGRATTAGTRDYVQIGRAHV